MRPLREAFTWTDATGRLYHYQLHYGDSAYITGPPRIVQHFRPEQLTKRARLDGDGERFPLKGHGHAALGGSASDAHLC
jgi:hypothetical protein